MVIAKGFMRRRRLSFLLTSAVLFALAVGVAALLPSRYQSEALVRVAGLHVPSNRAEDVIQFSENWVGGRSHKVLSPASLQEAVRDLELQSGLQNGMPSGELASRLADSAHVRLVDADVVESDGDEGSELEITFAVSSEGFHPVRVQIFTNAIARRFLAENPPPRTRQEPDRTEMLEGELERLQAQMGDLEVQLAAFKRKHLKEMPDQTPANLQMLEQLTRELEKLETRRRSLKKKRDQAQTQLAGVPPFIFERVEPAHSQTLKTGPRVDDDLTGGGLHALRTELLGSPNVEVSETTRDVHGGTREADPAGLAPGTVSDRKQKLADLRAKLAALERIMGPGHPEVTRLYRELETLSVVPSEPTPALVSTPAPEMKQVPNPAHLALQTEIESLDADLAGLAHERQRRKSEISEYQSRLENAPRVEMEYKSLSRQYETANLKSQALLRQLAQVDSERLFKEKEEPPRFTLVAPASEPQRTDRSNRSVLLVIAIALALAGGVSVALLREVLDRSVKGIEDLRALSVSPVLGVLPLAETWGETWSRRIRPVAWAAAGCATLAAAVVLVHRFVTPVDSLWVELQRHVARNLPL